MSPSGWWSPPDRQAGAQGLLGGVQTLAGGVAAVGAGALYESFGRGVAYLVCALMMVGFVGLGVALVGRDWGMRAPTTPVEFAGSAV